MTPAQSGDGGDPAAPIDVMVYPSQLTTRRVREDLLGLLARVVGGFMSGTAAELDDLVTRTLSDIGPMFDVDRAYMFRYDYELQTLSNTHEWCAPGITPEIDNLTDLPLDTFAWSYQEFQAGRPVNASDIANLPPEADAEREILAAQSIRSVLLLPMLFETNLYGFVGFDHVRDHRAWSEEEVQVLWIIVNAFARSIRRHELNEQLELASVVFSNAHEGIFVADRTGTILDVNPTFSEITGFARDEAIGQPLGILTSGLQGVGYHPGMWAAIADDGHWSGEMWNRRKDGSLFLERLTLSGVSGPNGEIDQYVGVFADITLIKQQEERLEQMAYYDPLTKLPNRTLLAHRMQQALSQTVRADSMMAVCYLDLDRFKPVNDEHGHEIGDRLLVEVAHRLSAALRAGDTVARLGGDEFVLILPHLASEADCRTLIERLQRRISLPFELVDGQNVEIGASIGIRLVPPADADPDTLLRQADQALYAAKQEGSGRAHFFDAEQDRQVSMKRARVTRVAAGLERREMEVHFQPIIDLTTGQVRSAEALVRWQDPVLGLVSPEAWLPLIEDEEVIVELGEFVLEQALLWGSAWQAAGTVPRINVNVSARELLDPQFPERLRRALEGHPDMDPGSLTLEVLESAALADLSSADTTLRKCRELGVQFALDDFGTGYSSLTYLQRLPVSMLKIDRSFVAGMATNDADHSIVTAVLQLARTFDLVAVAEGIESDEQRNALINLGCAFGQGYGIATPMPPEQFEQWVAQHHSSLTGG